MNRAGLKEVFHRTLDVLESEKIPYFVYGGLAVPVWGRVRTTDDVDIVVHVQEPAWERLYMALLKAGFKVPDLSRSLFFVDTWTKASWGGRDVDLALGRTEFDQEALRRAIHLTLLGRSVPVVSAEDLILYKLVSYRERDRGDVRDILIRQGSKLDLSYLFRWANHIAEATGRFEVTQTLSRMCAEEGIVS